MHAAADRLRITEVAQSTTRQSSLDAGARLTILKSFEPVRERLAPASDVAPKFKY
jgi:hypothetical protein